MITIFAIVGWLLFLLTAFLYWVGNKMNSQESNALAVFSLAAILSEEFRTAVRAGFDRAVQEAEERGSQPQVVMYGLIEAATQNAKACYKPDAQISTISLVMSHIKKKA